MRIGSIIIFHLSKLWKAKFSILCNVIFLVRLQGKFDIDHSWEWKGKLTLFLLVPLPRALLTTRGPCLFSSTVIEGLERGGLRQAQPRALYLFFLFLPSHSPRDRAPRSLPSLDYGLWKRKDRNCVQSLGSFPFFRPSVVWTSFQGFPGFFPVSRPEMTQERSGAGKGNKIAPTPSIPADQLIHPSPPQFWKFKMASQPGESTLVIIMIVINY